MVTIVISDNTEKFIYRDIGSKIRKWTNSACAFSQRHSAVEEVMMKSKLLHRAGREGGSPHLKTVDFVNMLFINQGQVTDDIKGR